MSKTNLCLRDIITERGVALDRQKEALGINRRNTKEPIFEFIEETGWFISTVLESMKSCEEAGNE